MAKNATIKSGAGGIKIHLLTRHKLQGKTELQEKIEILNFNLFA